MELVDRRVGFIGPNDDADPKIVVSGHLKQFTEDKTRAITGIERGGDGEAAAAAAAVVPRLLVHANFRVCVSYRRGESASWRAAIVLIKAMLYPP